MTTVTNEASAQGRIVVGYDGSAGSVNALTYAARLANERGRRLLIMMALPHLNPKTPRTARALKLDPDYLTHIKARAQRKLDAAAEQLATQYPNLVVELAVMSADPAGALAEASQDAALVVVGVRGHSSELLSPMLGGVSGTVIAHSTGPVMVVPDGIHDMTNGPVVVGLVDAADSLKAGQVAVAEAERRHVPLVALYAWDIAPEIGDFGTLVHIDRDQEQQEEDTLLSDLVAPLIAEHPDLVVERRVVQGSPRAALVEASQQASLVVIGSRGLGGFAGLLLGSVSRAVTRESDCPVIVVRQSPSSQPDVAPGTI